MTKLDFLREYDGWELTETSRRLLLAKNGNKMEKIFFKYKPKKKWKKGFIYSLSIPNEEDWFLHGEYVAVFERFNLQNGDK